MYFFKRFSSGDQFFLSLRISLLIPLKEIPCFRVSLGFFSHDNGIIFALVLP